MAPPSSPGSSQGTRASPFGDSVDSMSSAEPAAAPAEDHHEAALRQRIEVLRQQREVIAAQVKELERQEEEIKLEEEQIQTELSSLENRRVASPTPSVFSVPESISVDLDVPLSVATISPLPTTPPAVFSPLPTSEESSGPQPHIFDAYTNAQVPYCPPCNQSFDSVAAFRTHCVDKDDHAYCLFCERWFDNMSVLQRHFISAWESRDPIHNYESDRSPVRAERIVKVEPVPSPARKVNETLRCLICSKKFTSQTALSDVQTDTRCPLCSRNFKSPSAVADHVRSGACTKAKKQTVKVEPVTVQREVPQVPVVGNPRRSWYETPRQSMPAAAPVSVPSLARKVKEKPRCLVCSRKFVSQKAFSDHERTSRKHREKQRRLDSLESICPLCSRDFKVPSAVADHIESGACTNGKITRHHVTAAVHAMNISPSITITKRITGSAIPTVTTYTATELAFNGRAYECYLCNHGFKTLKSLNTHLTSPAHDAKEFICPHEKCQKNFKVLSALIRHIESECCGLAKLQSVRKFAHTLTGQFSRMLTL
ncbi:hypothetical protein K435DRAFT_781861 [Dendrothele bispora CBS 962.96]|uniref:C2H2-type domain-containing protein n=1 Tax=Dendrothele bispora (strain CBS 962.96) TaxID=1314807 RepID=A0A4S8LIC9_DENBC|nr:hypothetical protein K435DRAFT_781861 [Dendrothele bispora CBS 962.96]